MLRRLVNLLRSRGGARSGPPPELPPVGREDIAHLLNQSHGLPHLDWGHVDAWIGTREPILNRRVEWRRAVAAAWLDELRDALPDDHRRWRRAGVEGLGPLEGNLAVRAASAADHAIDVVRGAMKQIRGEGPIPPVAVISLRSKESYYSFISRYYPDEGEWGTSGGVYISEEDGWAFPMIVMPMELKWAIERTIAHEMTHHALRGCNLPIWVEEGLTQMMEERAAGPTEFVVNRDMMARHLDRWDPDEPGALDRFLSGDAFHSAQDDEQELAYHFSQLIVRGLLERRPAAFFAFARACRTVGPPDAAGEHLGMSLEEVAAAALGVV